MFANRIDSFTSAKDDKLKAQTNQNFDFEGEGFSSMLEKDEKVSGKLRETELELLEDEAILSTDEENKAIAKRNTEAKAKAMAEPQQLQQKQERDERNLLKLMEMSTQTNMSSIKINKSKKEIENTSGIILPTDELEDILEKLSNKSPSEALETLIDMNFNKEKPDRDKQKNNVLHETQEELLEDLSILSTDEENLAMARKAQEYKALEDTDFSKNGEADMELISELISIQNQANIQAPNNNVEKAESVLAQVIQESKNKITRLSVKDLSSQDVDYIINILQLGSADSNLDENENQYGLSAKFLAALKDSIINKKVFRIDFDNEISVIIKIDVEGKISVNFLTSNKETEQALKNNLYLLQQKFEEQNIKYDTIEYTASDDVENFDLKKVEDIIKESTKTKEETIH